MFSYNSTIVIWFYIVLVNLFAVYLRFVAFSDYLFCYACKEMDSPQMVYDYIIVGSGTAGAIVARRLAENENLKILLLEAGSKGNFIMDAPAIGLMLQQTIFDWQYQTVPQKKACWGLKDYRSQWPMGRIVGGTSLLNNMIYVRGHARDYATWFRDKEDYNYETDILPYFKKLENFNASSNNLNRGSAVISDLPFLSILADKVLLAAKSLGFCINSGLDVDEGFALPKATIYKGKRRTPMHQLEALERKNVILRTNTFVEKVLMKFNYEAYGVRYNYLGDSYVARATKGVILSAGVIGSPKILMLSGIGPKKHLKSLKIPPKIDLPVGDNLQDHVATGFDLVLLNTSLDLGLFRMVHPKSIYDYFIHNRGPWTTVGCESLAFFHLDNDTTPDLQFMILPIGSSSDGGVHLRTLANLADKTWDKYFSKINDTPITILPIVAHPKSRGTVRLCSKDFRKPPLIDPQYLTNQYDINVIIEGIQLIKRLIATDSMQELGARLNRNVFPGCEKYQFDTKNYWECYIRHLTITSYHPIGTCQLGKVVDYEFRVLGTNKLYVIDGSVLPTLTTGNPVASIMMMAEKGADFIKNHNFLLNNNCEIKEIFVPKLYCY